MVILDMEAPKSCFDCRFRTDTGECELTGLYTSHKAYVMPLSYDCPIKAEIPTGASNGDVIKAMFPWAKTWVENLPEMQLDVMRFDLDDSETLDCFNLKWWNAPYRRKNEISDK